MADFTHTISVVATLDGGRAINVSFVGTIEDVYECNYGTLSTGVSMGPTETQHLNTPVALVLVQCMSGMATVNVYNSSSDLAAMTCLGGMTAAVIGPYGIEVDGTAGATTNTDLMESVEFISTGAPTEFILLKTPVS